MRSVTHLLLSFSLVGISGLPLILVWGHAADQPESNERYYPPSELADGWRRCKTDDEVRGLGGMDPEQLARVGRTNLTFYGGPWQIVVIRHGYLVREWMGANAMPQTTFDV